MRTGPGISTGPFGITCTRVRPVTTGRRIGHLPSFLALGAVWLYNLAVAALNAAFRF